jgi:diguanylate cyclase (GGDEF)-like protein
MKIGGYPNIQGARAAAGTSRAGAPKRTADAPAETSQSREIEDTTELFGVPEGELTPKVREAILRLMAEVDNLRQELRETQRKANELEKLADQDPLAPVSNRRAFVRDLTRMMSYSERYGVPTSLIFFDVNGMKQINDTHGHKAGDDALLHVAQALLDHTRDSDVIGRLGGDEFGVILAQASEQAAMTKAEELVNAIEGRPLDVDGQKVPIRVAYGIFPFRPGEDASSTLAEADRRMYERKRRMKASAA